MVLTPQVIEMPARSAAAAANLALVNRAKSGDRVAFSQLLENNYDFIFRTACKWTGKKSDAEDIAQEVCIKLATAIQSFDGRSAFVSPMQTMAMRPARQTAFAFAATSTSLSPWSARRSECPTIT